MQAKSEYKAWAWEGGRERPDMRRTNFGAWMATACLFVFVLSMVYELRGTLHLGVAVAQQPRSHCRPPVGVEHVLDRTGRGARWQAVSVILLRMRRNWPTLTPAPATIPSTTVERRASSKTSWR